MLDQVERRRHRYGKKHIVLDHHCDATGLQKKRAGDPGDRSAVLREARQATSAQQKRVGRETRIPGTPRAGNAGKTSCRPRWLTYAGSHAPHTRPRLPHTTPTRPARQRDTGLVAHVAVIQAVSLGTRWRGSQWLVQGLRPALRPYDRQISRAALDLITALHHSLHKP